ncbi:hypothetical protein F4818DRAFT_396476 [Hypoxylon cercidicola]|nr:hypothetical protein F4818DRAFT_396476 [Hypoxylon cercidicola]
MGPKPRLDPYMKLLCRFYEPLILLRILGKTRGEHTSSPWDATPEQLKRRRLLRNLSYLCDYDKGGDTTTSIALEENEERFVFWVASNTARTGARVLRFLKPILSKIYHIIRLEGEQRNGPEQEFIRTCITFAERRVKKEIKMLSSAVTRCKRYLNNENPEAESKLVAWLDQFRPKRGRSIVDVCSLAYDQRKAPEMRWLEGEIQTHDGEVRPSERVLAFESVHHFLGRLAHHVRAPTEVIKDSSSLLRLFDVYDVRLVRPIDSSPRPQGDSLTTLPSILKRMLPANDPKLKEYEENIRSLDQKFHITERIHQKYEDKNFQSQIHAEIQVLEYFHTNNINFVNDDKYIGCSKPACYCCHLYFQHHQARPVVPESHQNIYPNWGVPALPNGAKDAGYEQQRNLMNKMLHTIRQDALSQIQRKAGPLRWHADSRTGITMSTMTPSLDLEHSRKHSPERELIALDAESALSEGISNLELQSHSLEASSMSSLEDDTDSIDSANSVREPHNEAMPEFDSKSDSDSTGGCAL